MSTAMCLKSFVSLPAGTGPSQEPVSSSAHAAVTRAALPRVYSARAATPRSPCVRPQSKGPVNKAARRQHPQVGRGRAQTPTERPPQRARPPPRPRAGRRVERKKRNRRTDQAPAGTPPGARREGPGGSPAPVDPHQPGQAEPRASRGSLPRGGRGRCRARPSGGRLPGRVSPRRTGPLPHRADPSRQQCAT